MLHLITLKGWPKDLIAEVLERAHAIKRNPEKDEDTMHGKTLFMLFEKPSLRTRVSFQTGMNQMGGDAIFYDSSTSPLGQGKESVHDTVKTVSRYVDIVMARLFEHKHLEEMAASATVPVINGLTNFAHPCQILADFITIMEAKKTLEGCTLAYFGDGNNNVTHSLMFGCAKMGINMRVACPEGGAYSPQPAVLEAAQDFGKVPGADIAVMHNARAAAEGADIIYTDSWMSYHIPEDQKESRVKAFMPYQVNAELMAAASKDAIFMNCLPAMRGFEQTAEVIDGSQSVVFDQAENRLHAQKAVMIKLMEG